MANLQLPSSIAEELELWSNDPARDGLSLKKISRSAHQWIREQADECKDGIAIAKLRTDLMDGILGALHRSALAHVEGTAAAAQDLAVVAIGGYGRGLLNPGSDIDLLILTRQASAKLPTAVAELMQAILYPLWDLGLKVGHATRSVSEAIAQSQKDNESLTALLEARLLAGSQKLYNNLEKRFKAECLQKNAPSYLQARIDDITTRHGRYSNTVFLQEPNVKESPGGLRDYHNMMWIARASQGITRLDELVEKNYITQRAADELVEALQFMHSVRNQLHFQAGRASDILTLHLQGVVATQMHYPERTILRRTEAFMRDYYRHARAIEDRLFSLIEAFQLQIQTTSILRQLLPFLQKNQQVDGFVIADNSIQTPDNEFFSQDPSRIFKLFQLCQTRGLDVPMPIRRQLKDNWELIDRNFRFNKANREIFQSILEHKGEVARILRMMHRVGVLGLWLPEFGALDCLVQHEFFHRYTADEHTLRCIEHLDALFASDDASLSFYKRLFIDIADPYTLYMALILHDTGRAENVREHTDGSAMLAVRVCNRLHITADRRRLLMFLVDHHLSFWRFATTRNIDDAEVVAEFARIIQTKERLDALMLFTYADSRGTNDDGWNTWKSSLMLQLYRATKRYLDDAANFDQYLDEELLSLRCSVENQLGEKYHAEIEEHFKLLPERYFRFRNPKSVAQHIKSIRQFLRKEKAAGDASFACDIQWLDFGAMGYTEFSITARNQAHFIEKLCCAIASQQINILSAEIHTRSDGIIVDVLRLCNASHEPVTSASIRQRVAETFAEIMLQGDYDPSRYLQKKKNFLHAELQGIPFPVCALVRNDLSNHYSAIEIQARDRIGLLHDIFRLVSELQLQIVTARIATEKGAALDTIYITDNNGNKIQDQQLIKHIEEKFTCIVGHPEKPAQG